MNDFITSMSSYLRTQVPRTGNLVRPLIVGYVFFCVIYLVTGRFHLQAPRVLEPTIVDRVIPLMPETVLIYITQIFIIPFCFIRVRDEVHRARVFTSMLAAVLVSGLVFFLFPTRIPRDMTLIAGSQLFDVWKALYAFDADTNCLPSLHVSLAILSAWAFKYNHLAMRALAWVWAIAIILSTMTTKQHLLIDVVGGVCVALFSILLSRRWIK